MRKTLLLLFLVISTNAFTQTLDKYDLINEKFSDCSYSKIYNDSIPKSIKFSNTKEWIAKTFGDYKSVLQYEDAENYKIIIKGISALKDIISYEGNIRIIEKPDLLFTLIIECKDDKYRLKFENMTVNDIKQKEISLLTKSETKLTYTIDEFIEIGSSHRFAISEGIVFLLNSASQDIQKHDEF